MDIEKLTELVFYASLFSGAAILLSLVISLVWPERRIWPPGRQSWQLYFTWIAYTINIGGWVLLGILDWNSFVFDHWARFPIGGALILGGFGLGVWGVRTLGWHRSSGLEGTLVRGGPYRFTRNPQYVGDTFGMLCYAILANSRLAWIVILLGIVSFLVTPFTEEPWLKEQLGADYEKYLKEVPRFL